MNKELEQALIILAEKLGTTVDHLWGILVKQAYLNALYAIGWVVFLGIGILILIAFIRGSDDRAFLSGFIGLLILIWILVFCFATWFVYIGFFNPEYYALTKLLEALNAR